MDFTLKNMQFNQLSSTGLFRNFFLHYEVVIFILYTFVHLRRFNFRTNVCFIVAESINNNWRNNVCVRNRRIKIEVYHLILNMEKM
jgi:hypothetical protein